MAKTKKCMHEDDSTIRFVEDLLRSAPKSGDLYKNYLGKLFEIVTCAVREEDATVLVCYREVVNSKVKSKAIFCRPLSTFLSTVEHNNKKVLRFEFFRSCYE